MYPSSTSRTRSGVLRARFALPFHEGKGFQDDWSRVFAHSWPHLRIKGWLVRRLPGLRRTEMVTLPPSEPRLPCAAARHAWVHIVLKRPWWLPPTLHSVAYVPTLCHAGYGGPFYSVWALHGYVLIGEKDGLGMPEMLHQPMLL